MHDDTPKRYPIDDLDQESRDFIENLVKDRKAFDEFVYTPLEDAIRILKERREKHESEKNSDQDYLGNIFDTSKKLYSVLARPVTTPNFETIRFLQLTQELELTQCMLDFPESKFTPNSNKSKYGLSKIAFIQGYSKDGNPIVKKYTILEFNSQNGKKISDVKLKNGISLVDFHNGIFKKYCEIVKYFPLVVDFSDGYNSMGKNASDFYEDYLIIFTKKAILFENFVLEDKFEFDFIKNIFLPNFIIFKNQSCFKPLIVSLAPTKTEHDDFWISYPEIIKNIILNSPNMDLLY